MRNPRHPPASSTGIWFGLAALCVTTLGCSGEALTGPGPSTSTPVANTAPTFAGSFDAVVDEGTAAALVVEVSDADGDPVEVTLRGDDAERFVLDVDAWTVTSRDPLDFELPTDADADNVYRFTLVATDGQAQTEQPCIVTVTNLVDTALEATGGLLLLGEAPLFEFDEPELGTQLAGLGDLDGDGRDDLAISAPGFDVSEEGNDGRTYVLTARALVTLNEPVVAIDAVVAEAGVRLDGVPSSDAGEALASIPDLDGDALPELVIGAPGEDNGAAHVVSSAWLSGAIESAADSVLVPEVASTSLRSSLADDDSVGSGAAAAGDVDGDGTQDLLVCADRSGAGVGRGFVVFGDALASAVASGTPIDLDSAGASDQRVVIDGVGTTRGACDVAASAGDVDGDGKDDLLVATRRSAPSGTPRFVHLVFGAAVATARASGEVIHLDDAVSKGQALLFDPIDDVGIVQFSVSSLHDIDGDGFDDILLGDREVDQTYVIFGSDELGSDTGGVVDLATVASSGRGVTLTGGRPLAAKAGIFSLPVGDVDGDGVVDIVISADDFEADLGVAFVVSGAELLVPGEIDLLDVGTKVAGARITGVEGDRSSNAAPVLAAIGDLDGDGLADVAFGDFRAGEDVGNAYVLTGRLLRDAMSTGSLDLLELFGRK